MASSASVHHALLRPCVLHILRAAGYQSTKPSVLDAFTDIASRYMLLLAKTTAEHALDNHEELEIAIEDVRMALQDCGALGPEKLLEDQIFEGTEDMRGVEAFIAWTDGSMNKEISRIAFEGGDDGKEDYLTALKRKHDKTGEETRYQNTILGKVVEQPRTIMIEGPDSEFTSLKQWSEKLKRREKSTTASVPSSRRQSSDLSSLEGTIADDEEMPDATDL